jgi:NTE family protein
VVEARLVTTVWPATLKVTAVDADTGEVHVFDQRSGVSLIDAIAASGALPGVWPLEQIDGRSWIDGGLVSTTNARLAETHERIVILAALPSGNGQIPGPAEDAAALSAQASVVLVTPDEESTTAIGPNVLDPARRGPAATAGRAQGVRLADTVSAMW